MQVAVEVKPLGWRAAAQQPVGAHPAGSEAP